MESKAIGSRYWCRGVHNFLGLKAEDPRNPRISSRSLVKFLNDPKTAVAALQNPDIAERFLAGGGIRVERAGIPVEAYYFEDTQIRDYVLANDFSGKQEFIGEIVDKKYGGNFREAGKNKINLLVAILSLPFSDQHKIEALGDLSDKVVNRSATKHSAGNSDLIIVEHDGLYCDFFALLASQTSTIIKQVNALWPLKEGKSAPSDGWGFEIIAAGGYVMTYEVREGEHDEMTEGWAGVHINDHYRIAVSAELKGHTFYFGQVSGLS
jgi:hypothetical protein